MNNSALKQPSNIKADDYDETRHHDEHDVYDHVDHDEVDDHNNHNGILSASSNKQPKYGETYTRTSSRLCVL